MDAIEFLKKAHDVSVKHADELFFDKKHGLHFNLITLYGSLIELSSCIVILLEKNGKIGVPSVFRTFLEAYVDLCNLIKDPKYGYNMEASDTKQMIKLLQEAETGENPYLSKMSTLLDLKDILDEQKDKFSELRDKGYGVLNIFEKFKSADMENEYRSIYNILCSASHSNQTALFGRHAEVNNESFEVVCYKDEPIENFIMYIDSALGILVNASLAIHKYFKSDSLKTFHELDEELQYLRKETGLIS